MNDLAKQAGLMAFDKIREIHTKLFSNEAKAILDAFYAQLTDGIWESNKRYGKYWSNFMVKRTPHGEVYFEVNNETYIYLDNKFYDNPFFFMSDNDFCHWCAKAIKLVVNAELRANKLQGGIVRNLSFVSTYLDCPGKSHGITLDVVQALVDHFNGELPFGISSPEAKCKILGDPRNDEEAQKIADARLALVELEKQKNIKLNAIKADYEAKREALVLAYQASRLELLAAAKL